MLKKFNYIFTILILILLISTSCKTVAPVASINTITKDSIIYVSKDTTVYITDSAGFKAFLECDSLGRIRIKQIQDFYAGQFVKPKIIIKDNYVKVDCKVDSAKVYVTWKEKHQITTSSTSTVQIDRQNYLTGWQWFQVWCGRIGIGLLLIIAVIFVIKTYTKLQIPFLK
jgi:hypothetical protein